MLCERFPPDRLDIRDARSWRPFPRAEDRAAWSGLSGPLARQIQAKAEQWLPDPWPALPASLYLQYARNGDRERFETPYFGRRSMLTTFLLAECLENRGRYLDRIADGIWMICEESTWCVPAHVNFQRAGVGLPDAREPVLDLFAAETAAALAWAVYLLAGALEGVSSLLVPRVRWEVRERTLEPYVARADYFWMGFEGPERPNNWNPWINSNILAAAGLVEEDTALRTRVLTRSMESVDRFLAPFPADGGCDEGPEYWARGAGSLYDYLETLESLCGVQVWDQPLVRNMARYILAAHIADDYYVNFADASAVVRPPAGVVYGFGAKLKDQALKSMGSNALRRSADLLSDHGSPARLLRELFLCNQLEGPAESEELARDAWLPDTQIMVSRNRAGSTVGLFLAAKGGHNGESHNHNDVGSFIVYADGKPLIVDAGVGVYTRLTFSARRYELWNTQSAYHTLLPSFDGFQQEPGRMSAARGVHHAVSDELSVVELDIAGAYAAEAGVSRWLRRIEHQRPGRIEIQDSYRLQRRPAELTLAFLTPCVVTVEGDRMVRLSAAPLPDGRLTAEGSVTLDFGRAAATIRVETVRLDDARLRAAWGAQLTRVALVLRSPPTDGRSVIGIGTLGSPS